MSQLFETLTAVDPSLTLRPALAESWTVERRRAPGRVHAARGLEFSDGTPLVAADVVRGWRRLFDAGHLSPLASLIAGRRRARASCSAATATDPTASGVRADGDRTVVVDLERGGGDLPAIVVARPVRDRARRR